MSMKFRASRYAKSTARRPATASDSPTRTCCRGREGPHRSTARRSSSPQASRPATAWRICPMADRNDVQGARPGHHQRADHRPLGHRQGGHRDPRGQDRRHRQGGQPADPARRRPDLIMRAGNGGLFGRGEIVTPGLIDTHVHWICPQLCWTAMYAGFTTLLGGGTGPNTGTRATTCTPGPWHIERMFQSSEGLPVNIAWWGKGNGSPLGPLEEQVKAGATGLKIHEDWAATPGGDRCGPEGRRRVRRADHPAHRHHERVGLRRRHDQGDRWADDPHLPHRRGRRRPRPRHHGDRRLSQHAPLEHQRAQSGHSRSTAWTRGFRWSSSPTT